MPVPNIFQYLWHFDDDEAPDGAWQAMIEDGVRQYNEEYGTNYDPFETWLAYVNQKSEKK